SASRGGRSRPRTARRRPLATLGRRGPVERVGRGIRRGPVVLVVLHSRSPPSRAGGRSRAVSAGRVRPGAWTRGGWAPSSRRQAPETEDPRRWHGHTFLPSQLDPALRTRHTDGEQPARHAAGYLADARHTTTVEGEPATPGEAIRPQGHQPPIRTPRR